MREIKFKALDKISKTWVYEHIIQNSMQIHCSFESNLGGQNYDLSEWLQYTGLLDKNGKEIYEGDIIKGSKPKYVSTCIGVVRYGGLAFGYHGKKENGEKWFDTITNETYTEDVDVEIIGNIYSNPELLKWIVPTVRNS